MKKLLLATLVVLSLCSWGYLVHRTTVQLALYHLPTKMRPFFFQNLDYLIKNSVRPDERRRFDVTEAPKHFIDLDAFGENAATQMPESWAGASARYTADTLRKYGIVPWTITENLQKLTNAFRRGQRDSILYFAADLGHYVGDAHVPLHTSLNYDGQLSNQRGIHALWESTVPELSFDQYQFFEKHRVRYLRDPQRAAWEAVRSGNALLKAVFDEERNLTQQFPDSVKYRIQKRNGIPLKYYTTAFAKAYGQRVNPAVQSQLRHSAHAIADFWYTAWVDAGKPDLNALGAAPPDSARTRLRAEVKAYKANELLSKGWLRARREEAP